MEGQELHVSNKLDPGTIAAGASGAGYYGISFDPSSGTTGGNTNRIIIPVYGTGAYISTDAGSTWSASSGAPDYVSSGKCGSGGTYYCVNNYGGGLANNGGQVFRLMSGTWSQILTETDVRNYQCVAVDPNSDARIAAAHNTGGINVSSNANNSGSVTWSNGTGGDDMLLQQVEIATDDVPWMAWSFPSNPNEVQTIALDVSGACWDGSGNLWVSCGIGVFYSTSQPGYPSTLTWMAKSSGIEDLVSNAICWPPGGLPILSVWDRSAFAVSNPDSNQFYYAPNKTYTIRFGAAADYAKNNSSFVAVLSSGSLNGPVQIFTATDGGASGTWSAISTQPQTSNTGGEFAVLTSTQWVYVDYYAGRVYQTQNGGLSWTVPASLPATGFAPGTGYTPGYPSNRQTCCADTVTAGAVYVYNSSNGSAPGVYASTDYGQTWSRVYSGGLGPPISGSDEEHPQMKCVPGEAGNLFWTAGQQGGSPNTRTNGYFMFSSNSGVTWSNVSIARISSPKSGLLGSAPPPQAEIVQPL